MAKFICIFIIMLLTGCHGIRDRPDPNQPKKPYKEWEIVGGYPHYFTAQIFQFAIVTQSGKWHAIAVPASDNKNYKTPGAWRFPMNASGHSYNYDLPKLLSFCWSSYYDQTLYLTRIELPLWARQKMVEPHEYYSYARNKNWIGYYNRLIIGLAPGGNVTLWLDGVPLAPSIEVTTNITTQRVPHNSDICPNPYQEGTVLEISDEAKAWLKKNGMPKAWREENNNIGIAPDIRIKNIPVVNPYRK